MGVCGSGGFGRQPKTRLVNSILSYKKEYENGRVNQDYPVKDMDKLTEEYLKTLSWRQLKDLDYDMQMTTGRMKVMSW